MVETSEKLLNGKNVLVTRPQEQSFELASKLIAEGANIYLLPTIKITLPEDYSEIDAALEDLSKYDWIVFTSTNAVRYFVERLEYLRLFKNILGGTKIASVGPATALMLEKYGIEVHFVAAEHTAEVLAESLPDVSGKNVLIPTTDINKGKLRQILSGRNAQVCEIAFYNTRKNEIADDYILQTFTAGIDIITFTSSSSVEALIELLRPLQLNINKHLIACIGPHTADTARGHGLTVDIIAKPFTIDGLIASMLEYFSNHTNKRNTPEFRNENTV
jgi:uroporphyrinogen III methyltransferase/synthase